MQGMRLSSETIGCSYERIWARSWSRLRVLPFYPAGWVAPNLRIPQTYGIFLVRHPVNLMLSLYVCSCFSCCSQYHLHPLYFFRTKFYSEHRHRIVLITMRLVRAQSSHTFSVTVSVCAVMAHTFLPAPGSQSFPQSLD